MMLRLGVLNATDQLLVRVVCWALQLSGSKLSIDRRGTWTQWTSWTVFLEPLHQL